MSKLQVMESLQGEQVSLVTLDRNESEYDGELLEWGDQGAVLKYSDHGREFITFLPISNIDSISHKVISAK